MNTESIIQIVLFLFALTTLSIPLGHYMARVYQGQSCILSPLLGPVENLIYKICGVSADKEMDWKEYAISMLMFSGIGLAFLYALLRLQNLLPFNPQQFAGVSPDCSLNTAISFVSNTNWQSYSGETTMSYVSQMLGLTVQNFVSAAAGMAMLAALIRSFVRQESKEIGNFWTDLVKSTLYVLLPLSLILSFTLCWQGVVQTFSPYASYQSLQKVEQSDPSEASKESAPQLIALGPAASQIAIKQLGTNGGGFFNVNSAHPLENPTPFSNFLECLAILIIPAALCHTFGKMVSDNRQGWAIFVTMMTIFVACLAVCCVFESSVGSQFSSLGVDASPLHVQSFGNMEGKETRFGVANSALWATVTTAASNGSVNSMHDSFNPMGGFVPMIMMQLGEVIFGGVGSGLYGMLVFAIITVFIAGLMVGRTPEYLGKKIEAFEMKMSSLVILIPPALVLIGTAIAVSVDAGRSSVFNPGAHGFSEILYAFSSAGNNNGSAFAGLNANTPFYNYMLGLCMFGARFWLAIPVLAIAGSLVRKKKVPLGLGTMPTHNALFIVLLTSVVVIFGALTFIPALALGPIVEQLNMSMSTH